MRQLQRRLSAFISDEFANAEGAHSDTQQAFRQKALAYYNGEPRGDEIEGRSGVISMDVAASVNTTLSLMRGMLIDEAHVTFQNFGGQDVQQAQAEADVCKDAFFGDNEGKMQLMHAIKDGLLSRQAVVAFDVEEVEDPEGKMQNEITIRAVPSENIAYQAGYEGDLQDIRFFAELVPYTRSDLVEMGCDKKVVDKLPSGDSERYNGASEKRNTSSINKSAPERAGDVLATWWCYILIDLTGDGITTRERVLWCDDKVVKHENYDVVPYALGNPFISPHRITGESLMDRLEQVQDNNTALQRQLIDNVTTINNGRIIYNPGNTNEHDVMNPIAGGGIRSRDPMSVVPMPVPDVSAGILASLEFFRRKRGEIAGASADMVDAGAQLANKSATQASIDKSNSELITVLIADTLANTLMKQVYSLTRHFLRTYSTRNYVAEVNGQPTEVNPLEWPPSRRVLVTAGKSPGEKSQEAMALGQHIQLSAQAMAQGMDGILASPSTLYKSQVRFLELSGVQQPETYIVNPASPEAQQAAQGKAQQAQQQSQMQQQMQQMMAQLEQQKGQIEAQKVENDRLKAEGELQWKYYNTDTDAAIDEAKLAGQGAIDLEKERMKLEQAAANKSEGGSDGDRGTLR